jgi:hypothetical protein
MRHTRPNNIAMASTIVRINSFLRLEQRRSMTIRRRGRLPRSRNSEPPSFFRMIIGADSPTLFLYPVPVTFAPMPAPNTFYPTPSTHLRDCHDWHIRLTCTACGRTAAYPLVPLGATLREPHLSIYRALKRFRCRNCGRPPSSTELLWGVDDARSTRGIRAISLNLG